MVEKGSNMADIINGIASTISIIVKQKQASLENQKEKDEQFVKKEENVSPRQNIEPTRCVNEVIAELIEQTPPKYQGIQYEYVFKISGDFGAVKTVSNFLKGMIDVTSLKYEKLSGGKKNG